MFKASHNFVVFSSDGSRTIDDNNLGSASFFSITSRPLHFSTCHWLVSEYDTTPFCPAIYSIKHAQCWAIKENKENSCYCQTILLAGSTRAQIWAVLSTEACWHPSGSSHITSTCLVVHTTIYVFSTWIKADHLGMGTFNTWHGEPDAHLRVMADDRNDLNTVMIQEKESSDGDIIVLEAKTFL